jgi:hypothetical protein
VAFSFIGGGNRRKPQVIEFDEHKYNVLFSDAYVTFMKKYYISL